MRSREEVAKLLDDLKAAYKSLKAERRSEVRGELLRASIHDAIHNVFAEAK